MSPSWWDCSYERRGGKYPSWRGKEDREGGVVSQLGGQLWGPACTHIRGVGDHAYRTASYAFAFTHTGLCTLHAKLYLHTERMGLLRCCSCQVAGGNEKINPTSSFCLNITFSKSSSPTNLVKMAPLSHLLTPCPPSLLSCFPTALISIYFASLSLPELELKALEDGDIVLFTATSSALKIMSGL